MEIWLYAIFFAACVAAASTGAMFPPGAWYKTLNKPSWTPPDWVFPVAWTSIYLLISFAGGRVAVIEGSGLALAFWAMQTGFSTLWSPVFFGLRHFRASLMVMAPLWLSVLGATIAHWQVDTLAGLAFLPYLLWVTIAAALNLAIVRLNPDVAPLDLSRA